MSAEQASIKADLAMIASARQTALRAIAAMQTDGTCDYHRDQYDHHASRIAQLNARRRVLRTKLHRIDLERHTHGREPQRAVG